MALNAKRQDRNQSQIRQFPASAGAKIVRLDATARHRLTPAEGWESLRGEVLARATIELVGGFPGSAAHANRLRQARLTITESWLVVNDGRADGFAIPYELIESLTVVPGSARSRYAIQIRHRDGNDHRSFYLKFPDAVWPFRAGDDALRLATLLCQLDIVACQLAPSANRKRLAMTLPEVRAAALETMVWSGIVSGPVGGWLGQDRAACQVWLTTTSFIWQRIAGSGINRIPLSDLTSAVTGTWTDKGPFPVVMITIHDEAGDRHDLPFVFDASNRTDQNRRDCAAMLGGLRMRDIPVSSQARPMRPWLDIASLLAAADVSTVKVDRSVPMPQIAPVSAGEFEAHCLIEIARLNREILGYPAAPGEVSLEPVTNVSHAAAVTELERRHDAGDLGHTAMREQRRRFSALIEARGNLAAIAEQRAQGIRPTAILLHQREAVMTSLNSVLIPGKNTEVRLSTPTIEAIQPRFRLRLAPDPSS